MRKSCAPSMKEAAKRQKLEEIFGCSAVPQSKLSTRVDNGLCRSTAELATARNVTSNEKKRDSSFLDSKLLFKAVWREISSKKHKTWKGDGTVAVDLSARRAVLKNDTGKYMGSVVVPQSNTIEVGLQLIAGGKEVELTEQITEKADFWAQLKNEAENRGWGTEGDDDETATEQKRPKASFAFQPYFPLSLMQTPTFKKSIRTTPFPREPTLREEAFILPTPMDRDLTMMNPQNRSIQEVRVAEHLTKVLRPHQREGVVFLYACLMGFQVPGCYGCILADDMGLGKTLQCLTVAQTMLRSGPFGGERVLQRVLIVTPSSLTRNWNSEINKWLQPDHLYAFVVGGKRKLNAYALQPHMPFVIVSYELLQQHLPAFKQLQFDLLICDEGHRLKNQATKIFASLLELNIQRRVILTGTPVQNDLREFYTLADFVNRDVFGTQQHFRRHFEAPIAQSQNPTASAECLEVARKRTAELHEIASRFLLRRSQALNRQYLGKKQEYICFVRPTELQTLLLQKALDFYGQHKESILKEVTALQIITVLKKICNHPSLIAHTQSTNVLTDQLKRNLPDWSEMGPHDSAKLDLVQGLLSATAVERREKCVLVSNHTKTLNMLQGLCDFMQIKCLRLDGATPAAERQHNVAVFNTESSIDADEDALVFLLSTKAGGVGLNLIGASRLVIFDNDWNPANDAQAAARIWRDGQRRDVQIYRLITAGCIEEKIFQRQLAKMSLGDHVLQVNGSVTGMKFAAEELLDLFSLQLTDDGCQTHASLDCNCVSDGTNLIEQIQTSSDSKELNDLVSWQHFGPPFGADFLEEASLTDASENLVYIFRTETV